MDNHELTESHWELLKNLINAPIVADHELTTEFESLFERLFEHNYVGIFAVYAPYHDDYWAATITGILKFNEHVLAITEAEVTGNE